MKNSLAKTALLAGLFGALAFCIFVIIISLLYANPFSAQVKSTDFFVYLLTIVFALYYFRFYKNKGFLNFWQGLSLSIMTSTLMLLLSIVFLWVYLASQPQIVESFAKSQIKKFENPEEKDAFVAFMDKQKRNGKKIYEQTLHNLKKRKWSAYLIKLEIQQKIFASLLISLFVSALLRKRSSVFATERSKKA